MSEFHRNGSRSDGHAIWCRVCVSTYSRAYNKNPDVKARSRVRALARYHALPEEKKHEYNRGFTKKMHALKNKYGLTWERYTEMLKAQGFACGICGKRASGDRLLSVDHAHDCCPGKKSCGECVRGLLCVRCNALLHALEALDWRLKAERYLARRQGTKA
jgi:hypothetical protein